LAYPSEAWNHWRNIS